MRTRSQSQSFADPLPGYETSSRGLLRSEGMMTRARRRRLGHADSSMPFAESGRQTKRAQQGSAHLLRSCIGACISHGAQLILALHPVAPSSDVCPSGHLEVTEWRDWPNLTTELLEDIAGRLLTFDVTEYLRIGTVCKSWREFSNNPRARSGLNIRFRPYLWRTVTFRGAQSPCLLGHRRTGVRIEVDLPLLSASHHCGTINGLLIVSNRVTNVAGLLNPFTGVLNEFPALTNVRTYNQADPNASLVMDLFKSFIVHPFVIQGSTIDYSTSPPTLHLTIKNVFWFTTCAQPGDEHWVSLAPAEQNLPARGLYSFYTYGCPAEDLLYPKH